MDETIVHQIVNFFIIIIETKCYNGKSSIMFRSGSQTLSSEFRGISSIWRVFSQILCFMFDFEFNIIANLCPSKFAGKLISRGYFNERT